MSQRIASLYATIGADTSKIDKSLKETKRSLADTGDAARDTGREINKAFDGSANSADDLLKRFDSVKKDTGELKAAASGLNSEISKTPKKISNANNTFEVFGKAMSVFSAGATAASVALYATKEVVDEYADAVENTPELFTSQDVAIVKEYREQIGSIESELSNLKFEAGKLSAPVLSRFADMGADLLKTVSESGSVWDFVGKRVIAGNVEQMQGVLSTVESSDRAMLNYAASAATATNALIEQANYTGTLVESGQRWTDHIARTTEEQAKLNKQLEEARSVYGDNSDEVRELEESLESLQKKNARFVAEWELAAMKRAGADEEAQLEFMRTMGLIDEGSIVGIQALEKLRDQKEEGVITTHQYNMMVDQLIKNITRLDGMTADAWIRMHYQGYGGSGLLAGGGFEGTKMKGSDLEGFLTNNYSGGALNSRGWTLVGDSPGGGWTPYAELVSPRGYVYSNKESEAIMKSGLLGNVPTRYIGGILESEGDYGTGVVAPPPAGDTTPPPLPVLTSRSSSGSSSAETSAAAESVANSTETVVAGLVSSVSGLAEQTSSISAQALLASTKTSSAILKQTIEVQRSNRDMISRLDQIVANTERSPSRSDIKNAMSEAVQEAMAGSI